MTNTQRGSEVAIHFSFFQEWLKVIESNIEEIKNVNPHIKGLKDFKWFCRQPKFTGGPKSTFSSVVDSRGCIASKTRIRPNRTTCANIPRIVKIYAIYKIINGIIDRGTNYIDEVEMHDWHSIRLISDSSLNEGDKVRVKALMMSGHPTHAPIQRIIRLRSVILKNIIDKIRREESTGDIDSLFWEAWKNRVGTARAKIENIL
jgi:hypothetical protein